jgi:hypothetical protein
MTASKYTVPVGEVLIVGTARSTLHHDDVVEAVRSHAQGQWGSSNEADRKANNDALRNGAHLLSEFQDRSGQRFWVLTESDRRVSFVLLRPELMKDLH